MLALSLRQPWANAVLFLGKNLENRRWNTSVRGEFLIHAAKAMTRREYDEAVYFCTEALHAVSPPVTAKPVRERVSEALARERLKFGGIVGRATLIDVIRPRTEYTSRLNLGPAPFDYPPGVNGHWHMVDQFAFVLKDIAPVEFKPCVGHLGFFEVPWP